MTTKAEEIAERILLKLPTLYDQYGEPVEDEIWVEAQKAIATALEEYGSSEVQQAMKILAGPKVEATVRVARAEGYRDGCNVHLATYAERFDEGYRAGVEAAANIVEGLMEKHKSPLVGLFVEDQIRSLIKTEEK